MPGEPEASLTPTVDGPEEMAAALSHHHLCLLCSGFSLGCPLDVSGAGGGGQVGEEQLLHEVQAGYRRHSVVPPRVTVARSVGCSLLIITACFMLTHVILNLFSFTPKKT